MACLQRVFNNIPLIYGEYNTSKTVKNDKISHKNDRKVGEIEDSNIWSNFTRKRVYFYSDPSNFTQRRFLAGKITRIRVILRDGDFWREIITRISLKFFNYRDPSKILLFSE